MNSASYGNARCSRCQGSRLLDDDYWEVNYSLHQMNTRMHLRYKDSVYITTYFWGCLGCQKVARRSFKVVAILLYKLGVIR